MTAPIEKLLSLLDGVQHSGTGYRARCPNCGGTSRKLSIAEGEHGTVLLNCFGCHDTHGILVSVGLSMSDLFVERPRDDTPDGRRSAHIAFKQTAWGAALDVVAHESTIVEIAAATVLRGEPLDEIELERLRRASQRVHDARSVLR